MLTSFLAVAATLLCFQANTWYRVNGVGSGLNSTFKSRARTTFAGAIVSAVADLFLILVLGMHDGKETEEESTGYTGRRVEETAAYRPAAATTTTTTTTAAPVTATTV